MAKTRTLFECSGCGHREPRWLGRCPECGTWNSFAEAASDEEPARGTTARPHAAALPVPLSSIETRDGMRLDTGIEEMNRVLGGGLMRGSSVLVGGEPGIGKSTLMLQLAARVAAPGRSLYVSGE